MPERNGQGRIGNSTVDGNLLVGSSATDEDNKDDVDTTPEGLEFILCKALKSVPNVNVRGAITSFAGVRAHPVTDDFIIGYSDKNDRFINVAGIEIAGSFGCACHCKICRGAFRQKAAPQKKADFNGSRPAPVRFRNMTKEEREKLIAKDKRYGRIICRCETITEGEILDAIHAPVGARDVDGVKRRTRAGMGRCQGGFCGSKVVEILSKELAFR